MNANPPAHWDARLSEYLDGDLTAAERDTCEAHLAGCAECARLLEELKAVVAGARSLPVAPPPAELWAAIESRLETPVLQMRPRALLRERMERRWSFSGLQLVGAAAGLIAVTVAGMWLLSPREMSVPAGREVVAANPEPAMPAPSVVPGEDSATAAPPPTGAARTAPRTGAAFASLDPDRPAPTAAADFGIGRYDAAIAELEEVLDTRRSKLNPETVRIVEANLAVVDKAIADARSALAADPASRYLNTHLANTMRRKVDLLRRVNSLTRV
jgi:anti-sigma factor RsiW